MDIIKKFLRLFWLNILWIIGCIPVITIGVSTCAAYAVTLRLADDDEEVQSCGGIARRFFKAYKQDLLQGIMILIFTVACGALGYFLINLARESGLNIIKIAALAGYILVACVFNFYAYPLIARYSNSFVNTLRNSVAVFFLNMKDSFKTLGIVIIELVLLYFSKYACYVGFVIIPALVFYTVSLTAKDIFLHMENPAPAETEENSETSEEALETEE